MLRTDTHESSDVIQIVLKDIVSVDCGKTSGWPQHSSQHRDCCGLACTIMTQQSENLTFVHAHVNTVYSSKAISECLSQVFYLQESFLFL